MKHPPCPSNPPGAEAPAAKLRGLFEQRSFALRNARRTNLLLGLARLHLNNADDVATYRRALREQSETLAGHAPAAQRANRDQQRDPITGRRVASLH